MISYERIFKGNKLRQWEKNNKEIIAVVRESDVYIIYDRRSFKYSFMIERVLSINLSLLIDVG